MKVCFNLYHGSLNILPEYDWIETKAWGFELFKYSDDLNTYSDYPSPQHFSMPE